MELRAAEPSVVDAGDGEAGMKAGVRFMVTGCVERAIRVAEGAEDEVGDER